VEKNNFLFQTIGGYHFQGKEAYSGKKRNLPPTEGRKVPCGKKVVALTIERGWAGRDFNLSAEANQGGKRNAASRGKKGYYLKYQIRGDYVDSWGGNVFTGTLQQEKTLPPWQN